MTPDLLVHVAKGDKIFIVGAPASGKTTLCNRIRLMGGPPVIHTDDYMKHGFVGCVDFIVADLKNQSRYMLEGVQSARALRRLVNEGLYPDYVIYLNVNDEEIQRRYREREGERTYPMGMKRSIETVMNQVADSLKAVNLKGFYTVS